MRYIYVNTPYIPKHCKYGPRLAEGIVLSTSEWWRITEYNFKAQRERALVQALKDQEKAKIEFSTEMTRNWDNAIASIKTLSTQKRLEKMEREKQDRIDEYNEIIKNRVEEHKEILARVRKLLYQEKDCPKTINSATFLSAVILDRQKQIALKNSIKEQEGKVDGRFFAKYQQEAEEFVREKILSQIAEQKKKKVQRALLDKQMAEIHLRRQEEDDEFAREKQDLINMRIEIERLKQCECLEKQRRKESERAARLRAQTEFQETLRLEEEEENEINKIYQAYARRYQKERKAREDKAYREKAEAQSETVKVLKLQLDDAAKRQREREEAAYREKEAQADREDELKEMKRKKIVADLIQFKNMAEEKKARDKADAFEFKKWELMQVYRKAELAEQWRKNQKKEKCEHEAETRAYFEGQIAELRRKRKEEHEERMRPLENETWEREEFNRYCDETLAFVKAHNLPPYPVLVAIQKLKKELGYLEKEQCKAGQQAEVEEKICPRKAMRSGCYFLKD